MLVKTVISPWRNTKASNHKPHFHKKLACLTYSCDRHIGAWAGPTDEHTRDALQVRSVAGQVRVTVSGSFDELWAIAHPSIQVEVKSRNQNMKLVIAKMILFGDLAG